MLRCAGNYHFKRISLDIILRIYRANVIYEIIYFQDEAAQQLTQEAKDHLTGYRSSFIKFLEFRSTWAFVVQKIKGNYVVFAESFQNPPKGNDWANPVRLRTMVRLLSENVVKCSWPDTVENRRRTEFCQIYEGYPDVCRCEYKCKVCFHGKTETVKLEGGPWEVTSLAVKQLQRLVQCSTGLQRTELSLCRTATRSCIIQMLTPLNLETSTSPLSGRSLGDNIESLP